MAYSPLGRGFLTGKLNKDTQLDSSDFRKILPRFSTEAMEPNQALVDLIGNVATKREATPAQIALAWVLAQKPWIVPILGTTKSHRLTENNGAAKIELTVEELDEVEAASQEIAIVGERYPEHIEKMTGL